MKTDHRVLIAILIMAAAACLEIAATPLYAQILSPGQGGVTVKKAKKGEDSEDRASLTPDGRYRTPNLRDIKGGFKPVPGRPAPMAPLYRRYPAQDVIVGEVGRYFALTRLELERMSIAQTLATARMQGVRPDSGDEITQREWERVQRETEDAILREWAFTKTVVMEAQKMGLSATPAEVDAKMQELAREGIGENAQEMIQKYNKAVGVEKDKLREQISDAILMDKYIAKRVSQRFSEQDLKAIYDANPNRYVTPMRIRLSQIHRKVDPAVIRKGSKEYGDLREEFYEIAKKAAKNDGRDFEELARQYSDDPMSKGTGGDMGWVDATTPLPEEITKEIAKMKVGDVSKMVETGSGFHVFRIEAIEEAKGLTYDESARQKVVDECIFEFKKQMVDDVLRGASEKVRLNASGLRLRDGVVPAPEAPVAPVANGRAPVASPVGMPSAQIPAPSANATAPAALAQPAGLAQPVASAPSAGAMQTQGVGAPPAPAPPAAAPVPEGASPGMVAPAAAARPAIAATPVSAPPIQGAIQMPPAPAAINTNPAGMQPMAPTPPAPAIAGTPVSQPVLVAPPAVATTPAPAPIQIPVAVPVVVTPVPAPPASVPGALAAPAAATPLPMPAGTPASAPAAAPSTASPAIGTAPAPVFVPSSTPLEGPVLITPSGVKPLPEPIRTAPVEMAPAAPTPPAAAPPPSVPTAPPAVP